MTTLSHSAAHERLADLALEPAAFQRFAEGLEIAGPAGSTDDADQLAAHVAGCADCRAELEAWLRVHATVIGALDGPEGRMPLADLATERPIAAPASLRSAVAAIAVPSGSAEAGGTSESPARAARRPQGPSSVAVDRVAADARPKRTARRSARLLPLVAVLAVVLASGGLLLDQARQLDRARADAAALATVTATLDRVLLDPTHRAVALTAADGSIGGSLVWSGHDLVVLTTALAQPSGEAVYRCWIERDGKRSPVGRMFFADGTGYWIGSLGAWATTSFTAGSRFGISLEPAGGSTGAPAVLQAALGN
ncbi:MAG: anti-sigma factor [Chloroflexi bacterium]|nr:anti-sigma factor [Chloroflexota bacterium]